MMQHLVNADGKTIRQASRSGELSESTAGLALGYVQANLVILPRELAFDFLLFCQRNPKPCPLLEVTSAGDYELPRTAPNSDIRTDVPKYCIYRKGQLHEERANLLDCWQADFVTFLLGCSFTFEDALIENGVPVRHIESGCNVPMYHTSLPCTPAGIFQGNMVVSMRPMTPAQTIRAVEICSRYPKAHGSPVYFGNPAAIGIKDINHPNFGDPVEIRSAEVPVFWACGVTPQAVVMECKPELCITHKPGHMFVTDLRDIDLLADFTS